MKLDPAIPSGPLQEKWVRYKDHVKLLSPANKKKHTVIIVGTGLAGASAAATLAELGYNIKAFSYHDSARRAHSIGAQGGINAAKNYQNDSDTVWRLFYDTIKGGDFRGREANTYRLAEISSNIIDQSVAQGVPFAREYSGYLTNRTFGGVLVSRTFYSRGATGQQLLIGAYSALSRQVAAGKVELHTRSDMLDLVLVDGKARGIIVRNMVTGALERHVGDAVILATGGYANVFYLSTNAKASNTTAIWRAHRRGAGFANPCYMQIHPTCIPQSGEYQSKLTLMSESLRNDGRVWVPKKEHDTRNPNDIPESERNYYLEERYPAYGNMVPRDVASRNAKEWCDKGYGVGPTGRGVYLDFADAIKEQGIDTIRERYGNLFEMYKRITAEDGYEAPMRIYPAPHYTMGGLWVDYNLMSNIEGLFVLGEANFSDHGANRLGASALMQGLGDGYFVIPATIGQYLADIRSADVTTDHDAFGEAESSVKERLDKLLSIEGGTKTVDQFHRELGRIMWDDVGMVRSEKGLKDAIERIQALRAEFWENVIVPGSNDDINQELEKAARVADFLELGETIARDALTRNESCGGHFRKESETAEGEARRDDEHFQHVAVWEYKGENAEPTRHTEPLVFETVTPTQRSYK
ncbi:MAG: fumarate reductase/succinate dehydrogenase flavoprotein subunit [Deltaproteobacteria bacterium]|nr:fumarate reductase/succinate dehydrogenase flavoprotein subunit [Deltaproteobacteria bacterium]